MKQVAGCLFLLLLSGAAATQPAGLPYGHDYFVLRSSLDNSRYKFEHDGTGRVAFLGGSITNMKGWRDLVCDDLRHRFPHTQFDFINAGIPSFGSTPDSFRFSRDVLGHGPVDLLFVEAAVNDLVNGQTGVEPLRGMEGIIRQAREANPMTDIVMLDFVSPPMMVDIRAGKVPVVIQSHENVADYYAVPSINLAEEVTERIEKGEFTWEKDFKDIHPAPFGQKLYAASIGRLFDAAWGAPLADHQTAHDVPDAPIDDKSYYDAHLVDISTAIAGTGWTLIKDWHPADGASTRAGFVHVPVLEGDQSPAILALKFSGTAIGMLADSGPDAGTVWYTIDGAPAKERDLYTQWSAKLHLPWAVIFDADLSPGPHQLELIVSKHANPRSKGHAIRIFSFLVNGS